MSSAPSRGARLGRRDLPIVLFLILLWGAALRGVLAGDARLAWGMFAYEVRYRIEYRLVHEDGRREPFDPTPELRGLQRLLRPLLPPQTAVSFYSVPQLRDGIRACLRHELGRRRGGGVSGTEASFVYWLNRGGPITRELLEAR